MRAISNSPQVNIPGKAEEFFLCELQRLISGSDCWDVFNMPGNGQLEVRAVLACSWQLADVQLMIKEPVYCAPAVNFLLLDVGKKIQPCD